MASQLLSLLVGDAFLIEEKRKSLIQNLQSIQKGDVPVQRYRLTETPIEQILKEARALPFLAEAQIFVLQNADALKQAKIEMVENYFQNPFPSSFFIIEAESLEKNHSFWDLARKNGLAVILDEKEKKSASSRLIRETLKQAGKTISPQAMAKLEQHMGEAPALLDSVLKQLINYTGDQKEITEAMVDVFEEKWEEVDVFRFSEAVVGQKVDAALVLFRKLLQDDESDLISLIGLLHWQIRRLWLAKSLLEEGRSESVVFKKCKVYPKQAPFFMRQLKSLSLQRLEQLLEGLFYLDWKVKTGELQGEPALEAWIINPTALV